MQLYDTISEPLFYKYFIRVDQDSVHRYTFRTWIFFNLNLNFSDLLELALFLT